MRFLSVFSLAKTVLSRRVRDNNIVVSLARGVSVNSGFMNEEYETIITMTDYWDGPRSGIANFKGVPHIYESVFDEEADEWSDVFLLMPIDEGTFKLALEDWEIWLRWEQAWREGKAPLDSHPALPEDRERHEQIKPILKEQMKINPERAVKAKADFKRPTPNESLMKAKLVKWLETSG